MFASSIKRETLLIGRYWDAKANFNAQAWRAKLPLASSRSRFVHALQQRVFHRLGNFTT